MHIVPVQFPAWITLIWSSWLGVNFFYSHSGWRATDTELQQNLPVPAQHITINDHHTSAKPMFCNWWWGTFQTSETIRYSVQKDTTEPTRFMVVLWSQGIPERVIDNGAVTLTCWSALGGEIKRCVKVSVEVSSLMKDWTQHNNTITTHVDRKVDSGLVWFMSNGDGEEEKSEMTAITVYNQCGRYHTDSPSLFLFKTIWLVIKQVGYIFAPLFCMHGCWRVQVKPLRCQCNGHWASSLGSAYLQHLGFFLWPQFNDTFQVCATD